MNFIIRKEKILNKIKARMYSFIALVALFVFAGFSYSVFSSPDPVETSIPNYNSLIKNPYKKYEKYLSRESIKDLKSNPQFIEAEHNNNLIPEGEAKKRNNPFVKSF